MMRWLKTLRLCLHVLVISSSTFADILSGYGNNMFASKTAYFWSHPRQSTVPDEFHLSSCKPIQFNLVARHAARYTSTSDMNSFSVLQNKLKSGYSNKNYSFISSWVNDYPKEKAELLSDLGIQEMKYLGAKYGSALRSLFTKKLNTIRLRSSHSQRTKTSASAFIEGMASGVQSGYPLSIAPTVDDHITRFYSDCSNYDSKVADNKTFMHEMYDFQRSDTFQTMIRRMENRLGLNISLSVGDVKMLYRLCATELAIMNRTEWCTLFNDTDLEILEYENDLEDYYSRMYGHPVTAAMTCPLVEDVFKSMDVAIQQYRLHQPYHVADLRFGHSTTIGPFLAALGLFKDKQPLKSTNYDMMRHREFFDSSVIPFAANVAFVLYDCTHGHASSTLMKVYVNEEATVIPACNRTICSYIDVRHYYHNMIDNCYWNNVCKDATFGIPNIVG